MNMQDDLHFIGKCRGLRSSRMRSGFFTYAERYAGRFTVTPCMEKLVTTHNVLLRTREDLGPRSKAASGYQPTTVEIRPCREEAKERAGLAWC